MGITHILGGVGIVPEQNFENLELGKKPATHYSKPIYPSPNLIYLNPNYSTTNSDSKPKNPT